ncbi:hypothetical protein BH23BAC3_BH23BAC3_07000 [soil metagenome]
MGKVNRCICSNISFEEIDRIARERNLSTVEELRKEGICSRNCNLCAAYIKRMLETGKTTFDPVPMKQSDRN